MTPLQVFITATLLSAPLAFIPESEAHACEAEDPAYSCGECTDKWYEDDHEHLYTTKRIYCVSGSYCTNGSLLWVSRVLGFCSVGTPGLP
jgi:hypothetical protein